MNRPVAGGGGRRGYALTLLLGMGSAGAVAVGAAKPWFTAEAEVAGLPRLAVDVTGSDVVPAAAALGLAVLAAFGAVVATRGRIRQAIGVLIVVAMLFVAYSAVFPGSPSGLVDDALVAKGWSGGDREIDSVWWRWLVAVAGILGAVCGGLVVRYAMQWATMGDRYDAPSQRAPAETTTEADVWRAIDRGDDPTTDR